MSKIIFTNREIERAWQHNYQGYEQVEKNKTNVHRLMLFYAVECGLKAIIMNREKKDVTDSTITEFSHNINEMLDKLHSPSSLKLKKEITLTPLKKGEQRVSQVGDINQVWRYGHLFKSNKKFDENDQTIEEKLLKIAVWIKEELLRY